MLCLQGSPGSYQNLPVFLPYGTPLIYEPISNPAQGRSARFGSTWSGGEVELVILTNSGMEATQLLRRPRRRLAQKPCRMKVVNTPRHP